MGLSIMYVNSGAGDCDTPSHTTDIVHISISAASSANLGTTTTQGSITQPLGRASRRDERPCGELAIAISHRGAAFS